jgi:hypothetical protein
MESETVQPPAVKCDAEEIGVIFPREIPEELGKMVRRLNGYAHGCLAHGKPWESMKALRTKFARRTGYSWQHVDRASRVLMKWCTTLKFSRQRWGRSTVIVFSRRSSRLVLSTEEVRRRLVGAILKYVAKSGECFVNRRFLENFHGRYPLPPEQILAAWRSLKRIEGCVIQWQQRGRNRWLRVRLAPAAAVASYARQLGGRAKFSKTLTPAQLDAARISLRQNASGISPLRGKDQKTGAQAPRVPDRSSGSLRSPPGELGGDSPPGTSRQDAPPGTRLPGEPPALPSARSDTTIRPGLAPSGDVQTSPRPFPLPAGEGNPWLAERKNAGWKSDPPPLHVCNRWVSGKRLRAKANFLAFGRFAAWHVTAPRVKFGPMHARNFAEQALRAGFGDGQICAAYRAGLDVTQREAERDQTMAEDRDYWAARENLRTADLGWREPSQVIAVAWRELHQDARTIAERWAHYFAAAPAPAARRAETGATAAVTARALPRAAPSQSGTAAPKPAREASRWRTIGPGLRIRETDMQPEPPRAPAAHRDPDMAKLPPLKKLPDTAPAVLSLSAKSPELLESHLKKRGLTVADLLKLSRAEQQAFVREAFAAQRGAGGSSKKD